MIVNMKSILMDIDEQFCADMQEVRVDTELIQAVLINEVVPQNKADDFYSDPASRYAKYASCVLKAAGFSFQGLEDLLRQGVYLTNAIKIAKKQTAIERSWILPSARLLSKELSLFPNTRVIVLMGDTAISVYKKSRILAHVSSSLPAGSTYKLRKQEFYDDGIRILPSYIMTGKNVDIEKSKFEMLAQDLSAARSSMMQ